MNQILLCLLMFFVVGCANSQDKPVQVTPQPKETSQSTPSKPTTANAPTQQRSRVSYITETSRPANKIDAIYPYDIDLKLADGSTVKSSEILANNGKPTVLLFWLTTCVPCRYEMKAIKEKYEGWQEEADFNLYAISTDFSKNYERFCLHGKRK